MTEFGRVSLPRLTLMEEEVAEKESFLPENGKVCVKRVRKDSMINVAGPEDDDRQVASQSEIKNSLTFTNLNDAAVGLGGGEDSNGASRANLAITLGQFLRKSRRQFRQ